MNDFFGWSNSSCIFPYASYWFFHNWYFDKFLHNSWFFSPYFYCSMLCITASSLHFTNNIRSIFIIALNSLIFRFEELAHFIIIWFPDSRFPFYNALSGGTCRWCLRQAKIFPTSIPETTISIYWISYRKGHIFAMLFLKYFIKKKFKTFADLNSKKTSWPFGKWQPSLSQLWESNMKIKFLLHIKAKLTPLQVNITPSPIPFKDKCLWWRNKFKLLKISLWKKSILAPTFLLSRHTCDYLGDSFLKQPSLYRKFVLQNCQHFH